MLRITAFLFAALFVGTYAALSGTIEADEDDQKLAEEAFYDKSTGPSAASKCGQKVDSKVRVQVLNYQKDVSSGGVLYIMNVNIIVDTEPISAVVRGRRSSTGEYLNRVFKIFKARMGTLFVQGNPCDNLPKDFDSITAVV